MCMRACEYATQVEVDWNNSFEENWNNDDTSVMDNVLARRCADLVLCWDFLDKLDDYPHSID